MRTSPLLLGALSKLLTATFLVATLGACTPEPAGGGSNADASGGGGDGGGGSGDGGGGGSIDATPPIDAGPPQSRAPLAQLQGSGATGEAVFTLVAGVVTLEISLTGVIPDGNHGIHIHEVPDCSAVDGGSAGPHWNPLGGPGAEPPVPLEQQLGELGNIVITAGAGTLSISKPMWTLGDGALTDVVGRSMILHRDVDGGPRIACGVTAAP